MIDISPKFSTLRYAKAEGILTANSETIKRVTEKLFPKVMFYRLHGQQA